MFERKNNGTYISYYAFSGGGGASKAKITDSLVVNSPYFWQKKRTGVEKAEQRGGPIPPGRYIISRPQHLHLGLCAVISPVGATKTLLKTLHRGDFLIHGAGRLGSDGCIVPPNTMEFKELMALLSQNSETPLLVVETFMEGVKFA